MTTNKRLTVHTSTLCLLLVRRAAAYPGGYGTYVRRPPYGSHLYGGGKGGGKGEITMMILIIAVIVALVVGWLLGKFN